MGLRAAARGVAAFGAGLRPALGADTVGLAGAAFAAGLVVGFALGFSFARGFGFAPAFFAGAIVLANFLATGVGFFALATFLTFVGTGVDFLITRVAFFAAGFLAVVFGVGVLLK